MIGNLIMTNVLTFASNLLSAVDVFSDTVTADVTGARYHGQTEALTDGTPVANPTALAEWLQAHRDELTAHGRYIRLIKTRTGVTAQVVTGFGGWWQ